MNSRQCYWAILGLLLCVGSARAEDGETVEGWGMVTDPVGDCEFTVEDERLVILVPGGMHDLWPSGGTVNAARVLQPIGSGDFAISVKVAGTILPEPGSAVNNIVFQSGTLLVWQDDQNFIRLDRAVNTVGTRQRHYVFFHVFENGERVVELTEDCANAPTWLRIRGHDGQIDAGFSQDGGETWFNWQEGTYDPQVEFSAGVAGLNLTTRPFHAYLEELVITDEYEGDASMLTLPEDGIQPVPPADPGIRNRPDRSEANSAQRATRDIPGWGQLIDPEGDAQFVVEGAELALSLPGTLHDLWPVDGEVNSPRVLQEVEGDFTVTVQVASSIAPEEGTAIGRYTFQAGTLLVWQDDMNFVRLDRAGAYSDQNESNSHFCYLQIFQDGEKLINSAKRIDDTPVLLRITHTDGVYEADFSQDNGESWTTWEPIQVEWEGPLQAGVSAVNATTEPLTVRFVDLEIESSAARAAETSETREIAGWGTLLDPVGDAEIAVDGDSLDLSVNGTMHDLYPDGDRVNSPMVLQEVEGDFYVHVKVVGEIEPEIGSQLSRFAFQSGALVLWHDEDNFIRFERCNQVAGDDQPYMLHAAYLHVFKDGQRVVRLREESENTPTFLRLVVLDGQVTASYSTNNGLSWTDLDGGTIDTSLEWQVGVSLVNTTNNPFTAHFEDFELRTSDP